MSFFCSTSLFPLVGAIPNTDQFLWIASGLLALSVFIAVSLFLGMPYAKSRHSQSDQYDFEELRHKKIRENCTLFRCAEPLIMELTFWNKTSSQLENVKEMLDVSGNELPWTPEEFISTIQTEALLTSIVFGIVLWNAAHPVVGLIAGLIVFYLYYTIRLNELNSTSAIRKERIRGRLPFVVDIMALTRTAGASFNQSLEIAAQESSEHPVGEELKELLRQLNLGRTQHQTLEDFASKIKDEDVSDIVFAINKAEELGTPIAEALSELADQMRSKKMQRGEKASEEAQIKISFPGMIIMLACLLIIIAPFILQAVYGSM